MTATTDNSIRVLTLRFANNEVTANFIRLAKRNGYNPVVSNEGQWIRVDTTFQNSQEKRKLVSAWASESMEDSDRYQRRLL